MTSFIKDDLSVAITVCEELSAQATPAAPADVDLPAQAEQKLVLYDGLTHLCTRASMEIHDALEIIRTGTFEWKSTGA